MDGQKRRRGGPAMGHSVDSLEAQKFKRAVWSGSRSRVCSTKRVHQTWEISKRMSLFKTDNDFTRHICFRWKWQRSGSSYKQFFTNWLWINSRLASNSPRQYLDGKSPHSFLFHVLYQILWTNKTEIVKSMVYELKKYFTPSVT